MAENTYKKNKPKNKEKQSFKFPSLKLSLGFLKDRRFVLAMGIFLSLFSFALIIAFTSYLFTGKEDQSVVETVLEGTVMEAGKEIQNWLGVSGAFMSYYFIFRWFGIASFLLIPLLFLWGYRLIFQKHLFNFWKIFSFNTFFLFWIPFVLGYLVLNIKQETYLSLVCGGVGYEVAAYSNSLIGWGTALFLIFSLLVFSIFFFNIQSVSPSLATTDEVSPSLVSVRGEATDSVNAEEPIIEDQNVREDEDDGSAWQVKVDAQVRPQTPEPDREEHMLKQELLVPPVTSGKKDSFTFEVAEMPEAAEDRKKEQMVLEDDDEKELDLVVEEGNAEEEGFGGKMENYDPTLDLGSYQYPTLDLLKEYEVSKVQVTKEELEVNKDKIVETLSHYNIGIASIKATIGPTVTLYEIVPEAGVRISKIKNLEDDIALSLSALGIRIIAPIPGKGTIGIEVPNKNKETVSARSALSTDKFVKSDKDLPIVFGKTISNEVFVLDLAKCPHLLIAGATGQGKSVGLNVLLTSLIYKKHPSQLKLVLVDPKKVELSLFNKLERHFLAKLPNTDEAIITDTKKVVNTLNSLCIEMDQRYDLLKEANCRNLKEYNKKFVERRLNPEKGHRFMPYIVLVIDELADLMMTAGKEVETPIARLAQLARAIGIHLVVATQRPSVNVITGIIKANFPARLSFKVTSKIDSRTILDAGGADQLIGQGDMLFSQGSELTRVQCAFIDTPEVEAVCEFIGSQRGYTSAYLLPEYSGEDGDGEAGDFNFSERDEMFEEAARIIVQHQQGSTSLLQRRLKLGYNRAGRLIDQLESAGIVGPFEGSKAREVLIIDEYNLEQLLNDLSNKKSNS